MTTIDARNGDPMTAQLDALGFDGEPFDALTWSMRTEPAEPAAAESVPALLAPAQRPLTQLPPAQRRPADPAPAESRAGAAASGGDPVRRLLQDIRAGLVAAHLSAISVQTALQRRALAALDQPTPAGARRHAPSTREVRSYSVTARYSPETGLTVSATPRRPGIAPELPRPATTMSAFKALARTAVTSLDGPALAALARGEIAAVFGPAYDQENCNPAIQLTEGTHGALSQIEIVRHGGPWNRGRLRAACHIDGDVIAASVEAVWQAAQVFAMQVGLQLCLAGGRFHPGPHSEMEFYQPLAPGPVELVVDVVRIDLIPRPWLRVNAEFLRDGAAVARVRDLTLEIREEQGLPVAPQLGGAVPRFFGRRNALGERALLNEFHMTHSARGDLGIALGPEFTPYAGRRATRMPNHGLQLCDRVMAVEGERGKLTGGMARTEYDSPADSWYYQESANASMPNVVYMETSLQSALLLGYFLGATLTAPEEDYSLRNLDGTATVLREVDLRDKTIQQTSRLLNTTVLVGAVLQSFSYELSVDGEPFYAGESLFGFFNAAALANQNGLDNGEYVPPWLDSQPDRPAVRTIDIAARREQGTGVPCSRGHLALLECIEVVDGGGKFGKGYLRAVRPVSETDWFFAYHFHLDPVMPGSLGIEAVIQAMQEWALSVGLAADLVAPEFVLPANLPMSWRYRGQILADDREMTLEVHIKDIERRDGRVRVVGEASVWKPGMRIYELNDIAVELRDVGAEPW